MRRALSALASCRGSLAGYSTVSGPKDYGIVMQKAAELAAEADVPKKEAGYADGVPLETFKRKVRIYCPAKSPSQSGLGKTTFAPTAPNWRIEFETQDKWINALMGWTSTADPLESVGRSSLLFTSKEAAIAFAERHGFEYTAEDPNPRRSHRTKRYADYAMNFTVKRKGIPDLSNYPSNRTAPPSWPLK